MQIQSRLLAACVLIGAAGACTIPTDAPATDVRWVVPGPSTSITVSSYLPAGVSSLADNSAFTVSVPPTSIQRQLSQDCPACVLVNGFTTPKPAFVGSSSLSSALPPGISSATIAGGTLQLIIQSTFTFDPLRPNPTTPGGATGFAVTTVTNGSTVIGKDSINGSTAGLPPNGSLTRSIPLSGTVTSSQPLTVTVVLNSPAGENVQMDASRTITVTATPQNITASSASITLSNKSISASSKQDLSGVDSTLITHVQSGALVLSIANPFAATGNLTVTLKPDVGNAIQKPLTLGAGNSIVSIPFTAAELRSLLGHQVTISYSGTVNATTGTVTVSPSQAVTVQSRLDLSLELGSVTP